MKNTTFRSVLLLLTLMFFSCSDPHGGERICPGPPAAPRKGIVLAGSSITWGTGGTYEPGSIMDRYSGAVVNYLYTGLSTSILPEEMIFTGDTSSFHNNFLWQRRGILLRGLNSTVEFDLCGDEIAVCQAALRTRDYGIMEVTADGQIIGRFTNHNDNIGEEEQLFTGDGSTVKFRLDHPATYDHKVTLNGQPVKGKIWDGGWTRAVPENPGYLIIRKLDARHHPTHFIWFREPPEKGSTIQVRYKYGRIIAFEGCTVGQLDSDEENECPYGEGTVSLDPARPARLSSGLEYRYIDRKAFWIHKFSSVKKRHFRIRITGGQNPYFLINFVSNRYHDYMNAGIGGWKLSLYLDNDGINDYNGFFERFIPDLIVVECATNDDWAYGQRKVKRTVTGLSEEEVRQLWTLELDRITQDPRTGSYSVRLTTGLISSIDRYSLISPQIRGSEVAPGDIVRIGTYHGDNRQVTCRRIDHADPATGRITWQQPLTPDELLNVSSYDDLVGAEISVRDLSGYEKLYEELIRKIRDIAPQTRILITQPGLSNYRARQLWGYQLVHRGLAARFPNVSTIEVTAWLHDFQQGIVSGKRSLVIPADGRKVYPLPWEGHWQGFEIWVNGRNLYGTGCYIECGEGYAPGGKDGPLSINAPYVKKHFIRRPMQLVFTGKAPAEGEIRIIKADTIWSHDFCHTTETGGYVYGQVYVNKIKETLHR